MQVGNDAQWANHACQPNDFNIFILLCKLIKINPGEVIFAKVQQSKTKIQPQS